MTIPPLHSQQLNRRSQWFHVLSEEPFINRLRTLDASNNDIKQVPAEVYTLINLKLLILSNCNIQSLLSLAQLRALTTLKLDHNDLEEDKISDFPINLQHLNLSHNHFQNFPIKITMSHQLITLDLSYNRIESLSGIEMLVNLTELNLDANRLCELPHNLSKLRILRRISLRLNSFQRNSSLDPSSQSIPEAFLTDTAVDHIVPMHTGSTILPLTIESLGAR